MIIYQFSSQLQLESFVLLEWTSANDAKLTALNPEAKGILQECKDLFISAETPSLDECLPEDNLSS